MEGTKLNSNVYLMFFHSIRTMKPAGKYIQLSMHCNGLVGLSARFNNADLVLLIAVS